MSSLGWAVVGATAIALAVYGMYRITRAADKQVAESVARALPEFDEATRAALAESVCHPAANDALHIADMQLTTDELVFAGEVLADIDDIAAGVES